MNARALAVVCVSSLACLLGGCATVEPANIIEPVAIRPGAESRAAAAAMSDVERRAREGKIPKLSSILIAVNGQMVYESYFGEATADTLHDTRSVGKSITALAIGTAMGHGRLTSAEAKVVDVLSDLQPIANLDAAKAGMTIEDLLTMSSPLAADDADQASPGNEDRMHEQSCWSRWGIDLPTDSAVVRSADGRYPFRYATINAVLLGQVMQRGAGTRADELVKASVLTPLEITRCEFQYSPTGEVMTGGSMKLTSRDLLKIGQLALNRGRAGGRELVPGAWVDACLTVRRTDTVAPGIGYGYLFWHMDLPHNDHPVSCWFMAGNGGNVVAIIPELRGVAVITRTDFNSPTTARETMGLLAQHVVPAMSAARGK